MEKRLERISEKIRSHWPGAEISVIKSDRDQVGPLLSVRTKYTDGPTDKGLFRSLDHIIIELESKNDLHFLVVPIDPTDVILPAPH